MTLKKYWVTVNNRIENNPDERFGQAACNVLYVMRPDLVELMRGTQNDPFYVVDERRYYDECMVNFITFLTMNW